MTMARWQVLGSADVNRREPFLLRTSGAALLAGSACVSPPMTPHHIRQGYLERFPQARVTDTVFEQVRGR